jgi:hypothetical protein
MKFEEAFAGKPLSVDKERPIIILDGTTVKRVGKEHMVCPSACPRSLTKRGYCGQDIQVKLRSSFSTMAVMAEALKTCESTHCNGGSWPQVVQMGV